MCDGSGKSVIEGEEGNLGGQTVKRKPRVLFANGKVQPGTKAYAAQQEAR